MENQYKKYSSSHLAVSAPHPSTSTINHISLLSALTTEADITVSLAAEPSLPHLPAIALNVHAPLIDDGSRLFSHGFLFSISSSSALYFSAGAMDEISLIGAGTFNANVAVLGAPKSRVSWASLSDFPVHAVALFTCWLGSRLYVAVRQSLYIGNNVQTDELNQQEDSRKQQEQLTSPLRVPQRSGLACSPRAR